MNNSIDKFVNFLIKQIKQITINLLKLSRDDLKKGEKSSNVLNYDNKKLADTLSAKILKSEEYESLKIKQINYELLFNFIKKGQEGNENEDYYHNFRGFFDILKETNFSIREKIDIIKFIMTINIKDFDDKMENDIYYYKFYKLDNITLKYFSLDDIFDIADKLDSNSKYLENYLNQIDNIEKRSELLSIINIIREKISINLQIQKQFVEACELGIDKEENVCQIIDSLIKLDVKEEDVNPIKEYLNKRFVKEEQKEYSFKNANESYNDKEKYKEELRKKIENYLEPRTLSPIRFLSYNELKEIIEILKILGNYNEELVAKIIFENEILLSKVSFIDKYNYYIELLKCYSEKYGFVNELKELNDYYNELLVSTNEEDNEFYINTSNDIIRNILSYVPNMKEHLKETI